MIDSIHDLVEPVRRLPTDPEHEPTAGSAVCLSGGGYRAMLFYTGVLWRLCETRWLHKVDRVSSVSGGSMTAAILELACIKTRLKAFPDRDQERLINWGYAVGDAGLRAHVDQGLAPPSGYPYARGVS